MARQAVGSGNYDCEGGMTSEQIDSKAARVVEKTYRDSVFDRVRAVADLINACIAEDRVSNATDEDIKRTFQQQSDLINSQREFNQIILVQHQIYIDVLNQYERSRWPWVRWMAAAMHEEIMIRVALAQPVKK